MDKETMKEIKLLIALVRDTPYLWKKTLQSECDENVISDSWENIASCLDSSMTGAEACRIFKGLEKIFHECNKMICLSDRSGMGANAIYTPDWEFYKDMCFLKDQMILRPTISNVSISSTVTPNLKRNETGCEYGEVNKKNILLEKILDSEPQSETSMNNLLSKIAESYGVENRSRPSKSLVHEAQVHAIPSSHKMTPDLPRISQNYMDLTNTSSSEDDEENENSHPDSSRLKIGKNQFNVNQDIHPPGSQNIVMNPIHQSLNSKTQLKTKKLNVGSPIGAIKRNHETIDELLASKKIKFDAEDEQPLTETLIKMAGNTCKTFEKLCAINSCEPALNDRLSAAHILLMSASNSLPVDQQLQGIIEMLTVAQRFHKQQKN